MKRKAILVLGIVATAMVGLQSVTANSAKSKATSAKRVEFPQLLSQEPEVLVVELDRAHEIVDAQGQKRSWSEAFMVRLHVAMPQAGGEAVQLFLDDTRIEEYGGWSEGIYFWIYDAKELESLNGQSLRTKFRTSKVVTLGQLKFDPGKKMQRTSETELRKAARAR